MSLSTPLTQRKRIITAWLLPLEGTFISNNVPSEQAKYILFLSKILSTKSLKEAFVLLNKQNKCQRLNTYPNIRFGRSEDSIWFAPCDYNGHLLSMIPYAAIFFKNDSIEH